MSTQLLVNVITTTVPAEATNHPVAHGLLSNDRSVRPTLILPASQSAVTIVSADETNVYLANPSVAPVSVTLRCERGLSNEVDAETLTPFFQNVGDGTGNIDSVSVTAPITNTGTAEKPIIGASVGSTAGTLCAGNDARLSNTQRATATLPAGTGNLATGTVDIAPAPPANFSAAANGTVTYQLAAENFAINNSDAVDPKAVTISIKYNIGATEYSAASKVLYIPATTLMSVPDLISFSIPVGAFSATNLRIRISTETPEASVSYALTTARISVIQ